MPASVITGSSAFADDDSGEFAIIPENTTGPASGRTRCWSIGGARAALGSGRDDQAGTLSSVRRGAACAGAISADFPPSTSFGMW